MLTQSSSVIGTPFKESVLTGGNGRDFMTARYLSMRGSNFELGKKLAEVAVRHGVSVRGNTSQLVVRAQRSYIQKNYPIHLERMRGVASFYGVGLEDDSANLSSLGYFSGRPSCSVIFYPPNTTQPGHAILSRNYDFFTGTLSQLFGQPRPAAGEKPMMSEPYVIEAYPDVGYPSLYTVSFDLFGCLDGVNSEGLAVAILADDETGMSYPVEPSLGQAVGLHELQVPRFLLDTCRNIDEAKQALLSLKQYYWLYPLHYIVADASGKSFVWEISPGRNQEHITEGEGRPQAVTNHLLYEGYQPLQGKALRESRNRLETLNQRLSSHPPDEPYSLDLIRETNACVFQQSQNNPGQDASRPVGRTLWHEIYDCEKRTLEISFYLRDEPGSGPDGKTHVKMSNYFRFELKH